MKGCSGAFFARTPANNALLALAALVARAGQQFAVLVLAHLLATLLDDTAQQITSRSPMYAGSARGGRMSSGGFA
jgi:hypothetical protein